MWKNERQSQTNVVINDKLQGTVVTYLGCGGIILNQIKQCGGQTHKVHETTTFLVVTLPNIHRF